MADSLAQLKDKKREKGEGTLARLLWSESNPGNYPSEGNGNYWKKNPQGIYCRKQNTKVNNILCLKASSNFTLI